jgi:hypothetical protein
MLTAPARKLVTDFESALVANQGLVTEVYKVVCADIFLAGHFSHS